MFKKKLSYKWVILIVAMLAVIIESIAYFDVHNSMNKESDSIPFVKNDSVKDVAKDTLKNKHAETNLLQESITREISNNGNLYASGENNIGLPPLEELITFVRNGNRGIGPYLKQHGYKDSGWFKYPDLNEDYGRESFCRNCTLNKKGVPISYNNSSSIISSAHYGIGPTLVITVFNKDDFALVKSYLSDNKFRFEDDNEISTNNQSPSMVNESMNIAVDSEKDEQKHYSIIIRRNV